MTRIHAVAVVLMFVLAACIFGTESGNPSAGSARGGIGGIAAGGTSGLPTGGTAAAGTLAAGGTNGGTSAMGGTGVSGGTGGVTGGQPPPPVDAGVTDAQNSDEDAGL